MKRRELYVVSEHPEVERLLDNCYELDGTTPWFEGRAEHLLKLAKAKELMWSAIMDVHCKVTGLDTSVDINTRTVKGLGTCFIVTYNDMEEYPQ